MIFPIGEKENWQWEVMKVREVTEEEKKAVWENTKHYQDNWKKYSKSVF